MSARGFNKLLLRRLAIVGAMLPIMVLFQNCSPSFTTSDSLGTLPSANSLLSGGAQMRFSKAKTVLSNKCASCHSPSGSASFAPFNYSNESGYSSAGLVTPGNIDQSKIITRLAHYSGPSAAAASNNMPLGGSLTDSEYNDLVNWVTLMGVPDSTPNAQRSFFTCNAGAEPSVTPLRRLQKTELRNTYADLLSVLSTADKNSILIDIDGILVEMPDDRATSFNRLANDLSPAHISAQYKVATHLGDVLTANSTRMSAVGGTCFSSATPTQACIMAFINNFGLKVLRRPVTADEATNFYNFYVARASTGKADLIGFLLMQPEFVYQLENQGASIGGRTDLLRLSGYEVASRISYHFWNTMPNSELFAAAANGSLSTDAGVKQVIDTVVFGTQLALTKATIAAYFNEWYHIDQIAPLTSTTPEFLAFTAGENIGQPGYNHRQDMINEINDLINYYVWTAKGSYKDLLTSDISFAKTNALAHIYNVPVWDGSGPFIHFPAGERSGLLTRAGFLLTGSEETKPIHMGVHMTRDVLCNDLPPPPPDVDQTVPTASSTLESTRDRVSGITAPTSCQSCHSVINPMGFAFEKYDSLGRVRVGGLENIYDSTGRNIASVPAASDGDAQIFIGTKQHVVDAVDLSKQIAASGKADACLVKNYYRYTFRKMEDDTADGCGMQGLFDRLHASDGGMLEMFKTIATGQDFLVRKVGP